MPSTTSAKLLPYPLGTDRVMDGDDQIRKLAQSVDNMVQCARLTIPITAANTNATLQWNFPVPFANANIFVVCSIVGVVGLNNGYVAISGIAASNAVLVGARVNGATPFDVFAIAVGPVATVA